VWRRDEHTPKAPLSVKLSGDIDYISGGRDLIKS
jgi:hypothetical protein